MNYMLLGAGFSGGIVRGLTGYLKHQLSYKEVKFKLFYFLFIILISGIIGLVVSSFFLKTPLFSFVVGYAGGDFVENIYKIFTKKVSF